MSGFIFRTPLSCVLVFLLVPFVVFLKFLHSTILLFGFPSLLFPLKLSLSLQNPKSLGFEDVTNGIVYTHTHLENESVVQFFFTVKLDK